jgi:hypothetical protein
MSKQNKKPTGNLNYYQFNFELTGAEFYKNKVEFDGTKDSIEKKLLDLFILSLKQNSNIKFDINDTFSYIQNNEQDLDFTLIFNNQKSLLELTEITPNGIETGNAFGMNPHWIDMGLLTNRLIDIIYKKSSKYVGIESPIDLLIYFTDNNAELSLGAIGYIRNHLRLNKHVFRRIYYFKPFFEMPGGIIEQLFPHDDEIKFISLGTSINI